MVQLQYVIKYTGPYIFFHKLPYTPFQLNCLYVSQWNGFTKIGRSPHGPYIFWVDMEFSKKMSDISEASKVVYWFG